MICCILLLLFLGPLGVVLAPVWTPTMRARAASKPCCSPRYVILRNGAIMGGVFGAAALAAAGLNFLDPPMFRHLCTVFH